MKKVYVTFGGKSFDDVMAVTYRRLAASTEKDYGVDELRVYDDAWLMTTPFFEVNRWIFEYATRLHPAMYHMGHCCWKPYIIMDTMMRLQPGDVVLYVDGDAQPISDLSPLFDIAQREGLVLFEETGCDNLRWVKAECFRTILQRDPFSSQHGCGRFQLFTAWDWRSMQFLMEWQAYMLNPLCMFDEGSTTMEDPKEFARNSSDQSVLSLLAIKYKLPLHRCACQNGWPAHSGIGQAGDDYPQLFEQVWAVGDRDDRSGSRFRNV